MNTELFSRFLIALVAAVVIWLVWFVLGLWTLRRAKAGLPEGYVPGRAAIIYFSTPTCSSCRTVQRPAIEALRECLGGALQVLEVDASARPDLASTWGVLSVPTTFIIDGRGRACHVNHGVAHSEKLFAQIKESLP
ncbi:MAG: thioredoxin family protein [Anaerolineales bacterium]|nr:thioredoxin family protein [Anaerolineales bacterium]